ncbi:hypothetical protein [Streptococcus cuniculi]|uniref:Uncharacterized protein n=1 Tax=Streptococcus cuniculi TaxID=1432788 RepID=A0A4Y9JA47_9STRE|nr:hypothetical protein [Streptococcus cuniculi]MBF0778151.1 hypothetical protein [Streptococcus cuniculi]TFU97893.1 hypothetical protein E4T82_05360 [Streptococcus cuniculi]
MRKYLEYAKAYLEEELVLCDNPYLDVENLDGEWVEIDHPKFVRGRHNSPHYRASIAHDLQEAKDLLERG